MDQINQFIIERDLKEKLTLQCFHTIKKILRSKEAKVKDRKYKAIIRKALMCNETNYEYAVLISILLCTEYAEIEKRVKTVNQDLLKHITFDDYWIECGHNVGKMEAVFFTYTYMSEKYKGVSDLITEMQIKVAAGENFLDLILEHLNARKEK